MFYYGLDVHRRFIQVCRIDAAGEARKDFRIDATHEAIRAFAKTLGQGDQVVLEATFHTRAIWALLVPHAGRVVVANPLQVKAIAHARIKTDKVDAHILAQLLRTNFIPEVVMPDNETWELRQLVTHRQLLAGKRTAIGDAIGLAVKRLRQDAASERVLILLTDGANTSGEVQPLQAAEFAAREGLTVYTVGVGADEMMVQDFFGSRVVNPSADLDEDTLREIAERTGGVYFRARDAEGLAEIYRLLDELEPVESDEESVRPVDELFYWPLGLAYLLALFAMAASVRPMALRSETVR